MCVCVLWRVLCVVRCVVCCTWKCVCVCAAYYDDMAVTLVCVTFIQV